MSDYKPYLTADENNERTDKVSWNIILDRNRLTLAERKLKRQGSMIEALISDDPDLSYLTDSDIAYSKSVPPRALDYAELSEVGGMCQKVNQHRRIASGSVDTDAVQYALYKIESSIGLVYRHKYFVSFNATVESDNVASLRFKLGSSGYNQFTMTVNAGLNQQIGELVTAYGPEDDSSYFMTFSAGYTHFSYSNLRIVDLTAVYGAGNEPTSTSDARIQWLISYLSSHPEYDAGSILTAPVTKVVSKGFNLWDEEWEVGIYNSRTGAKTAGASDRIRCKNMISVKGGSTLFFKALSNPQVLCYDKNGDFIPTSEYGWQYAPDLNANSTFKVPDNCRFITFFINSSNYGTTYKNDVCINKSNPALNGTYMPYRAPIEYPVPAEVQALDGYGYGINENCYNEVSFEGKSYGKKVAMVDLNNLPISSIYYVNGQDCWEVDLASAGLPLAKDNGNSGLPKVMWTEGAEVTYWWDGNKGGKGKITVRPSGTKKGCLELGTGDTTTRPTGVVYYELATPIETDISEYLPYDDYIEVEAGGSVVFENADYIAVPSTITYLQEAE